MILSDLNINKKNMRLQSKSLCSNVNEVKNGKSRENNYGEIKITYDLSIKNSNVHITSIVDTKYLSILEIMHDL